MRPLRVHCASINLHILGYVSIARPLKPTQKRKHEFHKYVWCASKLSLWKGPSGHGRTQQGQVAAQWPHGCAHRGRIMAALADFLGPPNGRIMTALQTHLTDHFVVIQ